MWRALLLIGCAAAIGIAAWIGDPKGYVLADPALARLLRGMALIKGGIVLGAMSAVFWRLRWPVSRAFAAGYVFECGLLAGATMLIWQLTFIPFAAVLFHVALVGFLMTGWRDRGSRAP